MMAKKSAYICFLCRKLCPDPVLLQCCHVFCPECLTSKVNIDSFTDKVACPRCGQASSISDTISLIRLQLASHQSRSLSGSAHRNSDHSPNSSVLLNESPERLSVLAHPQRMSAPEISQNSKIFSSSLSIPQRTPSGNSIYTNKPSYQRSQSCEPSGRNNFRRRFLNVFNQQPSQSSESRDDTQLTDGSLPYDPKNFSNQQHSQSYVPVQSADFDRFSQQRSESCAPDVKSADHSLPSDPNNVHSQEHPGSCIPHVELADYSLPGDTFNFPSRQRSQSCVPGVQSADYSDSLMQSCAPGVQLGDPNLFMSDSLNILSQQHSQDRLPRDQGSDNILACNHDAPFDSIASRNQHLYTSESLQDSLSPLEPNDQPSPCNASTSDHSRSRSYATRKRSESSMPSGHPHDKSDSKEQSHTSLRIQQHSQTSVLSDPGNSQQPSQRRMPCDESYDYHESQEHPQQDQSCDRKDHSSSNNHQPSHYEEPKDAPLTCSEHGGKKMVLYCKLCNEHICLKCAIKGNRHYKHDYEEINQRFKRETMQKSMQPIEPQLQSTAEFLAKINELTKNITERQDAIKKNIQETFAKHQAILDSRRDKLIAQLDEISLGKLSVLDAQREKIESAQALLDCSVGSMKKTLSGSNRHTLIKKTSSGNVLLFGMLKPVTESDMIFISSKTFAKKCAAFGSLLALNSPDPSNSFIISKSLVPTVSSLEKGSVVLQVVDFDVKPFKSQVNSVEGVLMSEIAGIVTPCDVENSWKQGQYKLSYQFMTKGKHQLHVKVEGHHVKDSPFTLTVKSSFEEFGSPILTINNMKSPRGITISSKGEIIVAEENANCISIFSPKGDKIQSFGSSGTENGDFRSPRGLTVDDQGDIIVADSNNNRIQKFSRDGHFIAASSIVDPGVCGPQQLSHPSGIVFNPVNRKLYMVDVDCHVYVFNPDLSAVTVFGSKGSETGQLHSPWSLACDEAGNVYVADTGNHRVQVFTAEGTFLRKFGSHGSKKGQLSWPNGIAVSDGTVFVSEYRNNRISLFTCEGQFMTSFGSKGSSSGELLEPFGLAVDSSGLVYICDCGNHRVQVF